MTRRQQLARAIVVGVCALAVGVVDSLIKGNGAGVAGALSRAGAPWLLLAFVSGAFAGAKRVRYGALTGLAATLLGLAGFYFVNSFVVYFGPYSWSVDLRLAALSGREYFALAVLSGPVFGALGSWWRRNLSIVPVVAVGAIFVVEAVARAVQVVVFAPYVDQTSTLEVLLGVIWTVVALEATRSLRERTPAPSARMVNFDWPVRRQ